MVTYFVSCNEYNLDVLFRLARIFNVACGAAAKLTVHFSLYVLDARLCNNPQYL